jgi:hypothetical protein
VGRLRLISVLAVLAALIAPASALAGTYSWGEPGDFTSTGTGANPEMAYGVPSWSYSPSPGPTLTFSNPFTANSTSLAGYTDSTTTPTTFIAVPSSGSPTSLEMVPAKGQSVALSWALPPFAAAQTVDVSGTVTEPGTTGLLCAGTTWSLANNGTAVPGASGTGSGSISPTSAVTVSPGTSLVLTVTDASTLLDGWSIACDTTDVTLALSIASTPPAVTLNAPTISAGQPSFSGAAGTDFGDEPGITVNIYSGSTASGTPVQTLNANESAGTWSAAPSTALAPGTYTATAQQSDVAGDTAVSQPQTFTVPPVGVAPTVTLNAPPSEPLASATPTFTGTAGTSPGDSEVALGIYSGTDTSGTPLRFIPGPVDGSGNWSIQVTPGLANGQYTAVAGQTGSSGLVGLSSPVQFTITVSGGSPPPPPPSSTVTLTEPAAGASVQQGSKLVFAGAAGTASGDSSTITVTLWKGGSASGAPVGTVNATASNGSWTATYPSQLSLGLYTAQASQTDGQGNTDTSQTNTFLIVPSTGTIGVTVDLSKSRMVSIPISCQVAVGDCAGTVLAVTVHKYQPATGGPIGPMKLMFDYVTVPAGTTFIARGHVSGNVMRAIRRRKGAVKIKVTTTLTDTGSGVVTTTSTLNLRLH